MDAFPLTEGLSVLKAAFDLAKGLKEKAELARAGIEYRELAERLTKHGLKETEASIANKISRGTFSATFLLASLVAIGREQVTLADI